MARVLSGFISDTDAPIKLAAKVDHPLLILHSRNDGLVPWSESLRYCESVSSKDVQFASHLDSGHAAVLQNDISSYRKMMLEWMESRKGS